MANTLLHRVEVVSRIAVFTVGHLVEALGTIPAPDAPNYELENALVVETLEEALSDGSVVTTIRIVPR